MNLKEIEGLRAIIREIYYNGYFTYLQNEVEHLEGLIDKKLLWALQLDRPLDEWVNELEELRKTRKEEREKWIIAQDLIAKDGLEKMKSCSHDFKLEKVGWFSTRKTYCNKCNYYFVR